MVDQPQNTKKDPQIHHAPQIQLTERIPNWHSFNILHMEGIAGELKGAGITQNEMKSGEGYSKWNEVFNWIGNKWQSRLIDSNQCSRLCPKEFLHNSLQGVTVPGNETSKDWKF